MRNPQPWGDFVEESNTNNKSPFIKDTGKQFGYHTALEPTAKRQGSNVIWKMKCVCGRIIEKQTYRLSDYSSCGCMKIWKS